MNLKDNKVVGIDIDCVLTELEPTMQFMADYFDKPLAEVHTVTDYNLSEAYNVTEEEALKFWEIEEHKICERSVPSYERIDSIYKNFVSEDTAVVIITSRGSDHEEVTAEWLDAHNIDYDMLIMTSGQSKKRLIEILGFDYMIDDKDELFYEMKESDTKMVCVDYNYNKNVPSEFRMTREGIVYEGTNPHK